MANFCENNLRVSGDVKELKDFVKKVGKKFDFNKVVPMPKKYEKGEKWWGWRISHWGCKWTPYTESINVELDNLSDGSIFASFDTPWSPPVEFIKTASKKYKNLSFLLRYEEPGMGFTGIALAKKGKVKDYCLSY
jgi:hypothetical protein